MSRNDHGTLICFVSARWVEELGFGHVTDQEDSDTDSESVMSLRAGKLR